VNIPENVEIARLADLPPDAIPDASGLAQLKAVAELLAASHLDAAVVPATTIRLPG
jgi:hypothetical protein